MREKMGLDRVTLDQSIDVAGTLIQNIVDKNDIPFNKVLGLIKQKRKEERIVLFPACILTRSLGILEAVTKYLKEEIKLSLHEIAFLLNRDDRPIWVTYNQARKKQPKRFKISRATELIPINIFRNRKLGTLESLVKYLKEDHKLRNKDIAKITKRNTKTIWSCYERVKAKK
jgi:hypothetical protein